jgi:hypothetical protein
MPGRGDMVNPKTYMAKLPARHVYLVLSPSEQNAGRLIGALPDGAVEQLDRAMAADPGFRLVYRRGKASIYELRQGGRP